MAAWDLDSLVGVRLDEATRIVLLHERSRSFRPYGLVELTLQLLAAVILIPFWIYLLFASLGFVGEGGGESGGDSSARRRKVKPKYRVSPLFAYHHDLVLRVFGKDGVHLHEARARVTHAEEGHRLVASLLNAAQANGLVVVESVGEAGQGFHDPVQFWYGGRPLMARPDLRPLEELEQRLRNQGFQLVAEDGRQVLRRVSPPPHPIIPILMLAFAVYVGILAASLWLLPAVLFALFLVRRQLGNFLLELFCGLLRIEERQELAISGSEVSYFGRRAWRRTRRRIGAGELLAVGAYGTLSWCDGVQRDPSRLHLIGTSATAVLPESFAEENQRLVADWLTARLLAEREGISPVALRSRCAYCAALVDFGTSQSCPSCGAPFLGRTG